jgi:hypothetical protein
MSRTPPQIVQAAEEPTTALSAFIAQELEAHGFNIGRFVWTGGGDRIFRVRPPAGELGQTLIVKVTVER